MIVEQNLVIRYTQLLNSGNKNPYYPTSAEWERDIEIKILELKAIISHDNKRANQQQK